MESVLELMLETTRPFDREVDRETNETRYRIGLETIVEFLDANPPEGAGFLAGSRGWWTNDVADHLGLDVDAPHTEWWFDDTELGLKGKIDLVHSPAELLDYKSGKHYSASQVVSNSTLDPPSDTPNFQALAYLAYLRELNPGETLSFTFFHFLETLDDVVAGEANLEDCLATVTYHPVTFEAYIAREAVFEELREAGSGDCRKTLDQIEYGSYAEVLAEHPFPEGSTKAEVMDSALGEALHHRLSAAVGDYSYVENGCAQALSYLADVRDANFFADDLDAFEAFVDERLEELNTYRSGEKRFPVEGLDGEPNWRRVDHRDMLLEGDA
ncbi:MAG: PD-(D/E)XK nuclease family protein [Halobacteriales archaeon]|nr:PD-(D/E)XK nuclease family protein [Halobacteriales archaeon]